MKDQKQKDETIRTIEQLQLSNHLVHALDDAEKADSVVKAIYGLKRMCTQWH